MIKEAEYRGEIVGLKIALEIFKEAESEGEICFVPSIEDLNKICHSHPTMEAIKNIDYNHIIVDRDIVNKILKLYKMKE